MALLPAWQEVEYVIHYFITYRPKDISVFELFWQEYSFTSHYELYIIGALLGTTSGNLVIAWKQHDFLGIRRTIIWGSLLSFFVSYITLLIGIIYLV